MPIFEYACETCHHKFEKLVLNGKTDIECPSCQGTNLRKLFSVFASIAAEEPTCGSSYDAGPCGSCERPCEL